MKVYLTIAGVGMLALLALVFVFRDQASANDGPTCAPTGGFIPQFCVNVPVGTSPRRETTVPLSTVLTARADVRIEAGVPAQAVVRLASSVDNAVARVERVLDRPFTTKPRILVFATRASFARGTQDLFGYSAETAASVAATYGGVFDAQTLTITVSWQSAAGSDLTDLLSHELTHLATREVVGRDAVLPAWFEEGLAAEIQAGDPGIDGDTRLAARSLLANAPRTLDAIATLSDWHRAYATIGVALYAVSAEAVGAIMAGFTGELALRPTVAVGGAVDGSGNLRWTLSGFAPNSDVRVTISGKSYDLAYTVRTDGIGMYRGTFGSTAALGAYTLTAQTMQRSATATIDTGSR